MLGAARDASDPRLISTFRVEDAGGREAEGLLVGIPHLTGTLLSDQSAGVEAIGAAVRFCHDAGATIVGLGAVAAVIGGQGKAVARDAPCPVTTGNTFTAFAAVETFARWQRMIGGHRPVALLGPPGPVATGVLRALLLRGEHVRIVDPQPSARLRRTVETLVAAGPGRAEFVSDGLEPLARGQVLIAASSTGGRLRLSALPPRSVVIDVAAPVDVVRDVPDRPDVLLLDGEYVRLPRPVRSSDVWRRAYGLVTGQARHVFACFAEPMLLALSGQAESLSLGRDVGIEQMDRVADLAAAHGFAVDELFERGRRLSAARAAGFGHQRRTAPTSDSATTP